MTRDVAELRKELDELSPRQRAELARALIDSLDDGLADDVEQLMISW